MDKLADMCAMCGFCRKPICDDVKSVMCDGLCGLYYHYHCTKLNEPTMRLVKTSKNIFWTCDSCMNKSAKKFLLAFNEITEEINELKIELNKFKDFKSVNEQLKLKTCPYSRTIESESCVCQSMSEFSNAVSNLLSTINEWSFDIFALSDATNGKPMKHLGWELMYTYNLLYLFKIPPVTLVTFLHNLELGCIFNNNSFHNNVHGADVMQTMHYMLNETGFKLCLNDMEIFVTIIAALVKTYNHTGSTNDFHVMSQSNLAILYNDQSVLENHHISSAFCLMKNETCNILANLERSDYKKFRELITKIMLGTDKSIVELNIQTMSDSINADLPIEKSDIITLMLYCSDICHNAKIWTLANRWAMLLVDEYFLQGDAERALGLPVTKFCNREEGVMGEFELGFIRNTLQPTLEICWDIFHYIFKNAAKYNYIKVRSDMVENLNTTKQWEMNIQKNSDKWLTKYRKNMDVKMTTLQALENEQHLECTFQPF